MDLGQSRVQTITEILMDTQTEIKMLIKKAIIDVKIMISFNTRVVELIDKNLKDIEKSYIKDQARQTLLRFAKREYQQMITALNLGNLPILLAFSEYNIMKAINVKEVQRQINEKLQVLSRGEVNRAYSQLGNSQAKVSNHTSLYGLSELDARYRENMEMVDNLKEKTNLVICDTHSDCSDRCFKWQGRIYSLDGSYGTTPDGRQYIPLEVATNAIFKGHRNGLLGYNCRHKLVPYRVGIKAVRVTREEQQKQKQISATQRALEREIRHTKDLAITFKGIDKDKYNYYRTRTIGLTQDYKQFCQDNNRVEYRSRLEI